ncbi:MAG: hypothetical protein ABMA64_20355, partial [Myxococcota bacterium]
QLATFDELRVLGERVTAELLAVEAELGELDARLARLGLSDPTDAAPTDAASEVRALRERMHILEQSAANTLREVQ